MKVLTIAIMMMSSMTSSASDQPVLLDAACKVSCLVNVKEVVTSQTISHQSEYTNIYVDFDGISRQLLDQKTGPAELDKLCKNAISKNSISQKRNADCLTFKD
jgi:hypothetical protein